MKGKFDLATEVMRFKVSWVVLVLNIVDSGLVVFTPLKVVLDFETFDPLWVHGALNDLSLAKFIPLVPTLSVEHNNHAFG